MYRLTILIAGAAIGVGLLGACGSSGSASAASLTIEAGDFYFKPADVAVAAGKAAKIAIENTGVLTHNFSISELGVNKDVEIGETATVTVRPKQTGKLQLVCSYHKAQGMTGSLTVS